MSNKAYRLILILIPVLLLTGCGISIKNDYKSSNKENVAVVNQEADNQKKDKQDNPIVATTTALRAVTEPAFIDYEIINGKVVCEAQKHQFAEKDFNLDSDSDGLKDVEERNYCTNPNSKDTDGDGLTDYEEVKAGLDPLKADADLDGLSDYDEVVVYKTLSNNADTDGDGYSDGEEVKNGFNPNGSGLINSGSCTNYLNGSNRPTSKEICVKESGISRESCYLSLALRTKDISVCDMLSDYLDGRAMCLINLVNQKPNISSCEVVKKEYPERYEWCKKDFTPIQGDYSSDKGNILGIKNIRANLEMYYKKNRKYPLDLRDMIKDCTAFSIPTGIIGTTQICKNNYQFKYTYLDDQNYSLTYCLDGDSDFSEGFLVGLNTASPKGIK